MSESIDEIPYWTSPPIEFVFKQSVEVNYSAHYVFPINKGDFVPNLNVLDNALYYIQTLTFAGDVAQDDYQGAILTFPVFNLYLAGEAANPQLRNPIDLPLYFSNFTYRKFLLPRESEGNEFQLAENKFQGSFQGELLQTPALTGKQELSLTMIMAVQEITDDGFVQKFKENYLKTFKG